MSAHLSNGHHSLRRLRAFAVLLLAMAAGGAWAADSGGQTVASAGSLSIKQQELETVLRKLDANERQALRSDPAGVERWLRQRLAGEALLQEARRKDWAARPEVKAQVDAAVREVSERIIANSYLESVAKVPENYPSDAELRAAYEQEKANLQVPAFYQLAQIFLAAPASDAAAVTRTRASAEALARQAAAGDFAALARQYSQDESSAARGGEVGSLPLAQILPEMRPVVAGMKAGEVRGPVQSAAGFHLVKLLASTPARVATLEEVVPRLRAALRQQRLQQQIATHMDGLVPASTMKIDSAAVTATLNKAD